MPTDTGGEPAATALRHCRELLASADIAAALHEFSRRFPKASFELCDTAGVVVRHAAKTTATELKTEEFTGRMWRGSCSVPASEPTALETCLLLMEQFDRRTAEAWTDPLTGLPNRRWLDFELKRQPPALVGFFDVIGLQATNREQGHAAGDQRLCAAAAALQELAEPSGRVFRIGGDEFVVLLADADVAFDAPAGLRVGWGHDLNEANEKVAPAS